MNQGLMLKSPAYHRAMDKIAQFTRRKGRRYLPGVIAAVAVTLVFYVLRFFTDNRLRIAGAFGAVMIFATNSSFAFYEASGREERDVAGAQRVYETDLFAGNRKQTLTIEEHVLLGAESGSFSPEDLADTDAFLEADTAAYAEEEEMNGVFRPDDWKLILVNKQHPIPDGYEVPLGDINREMQCDRRILSPLQDLLRASRADGVRIYVASPYRSDEKQNRLFHAQVSRNMREGMSYAKAYTTASQAVTIPGSSEHQIGLSIDFISDDYSRLDEGFAATDAGKWLAAHCHEYGFILRYPKGREHITAIEFEPWHFRYVGREAAGIIMKEGLTLEEFHTLYVRH